MKNKKKKIKIIVGIVSIVIIIICLVLQILINKDTERLKEEGKKFETLIVETKSGKQIETEYMRLEGETFYIKMPKNFSQLDKQTILKKYSGDVPDIVFSNEETTINVAISLTENKMKNNQIKEFNQMMENLWKEKAEILTTNVYEVNHHQVGQIKLITNAVDTKIYNNIICFSYQDKLVIVTFNCTEELKEEWMNVGDFIIESLFFKEQ